MMIKIRIVNNSRYSVTSDVKSLEQIRLLVTGEETVLIDQSIHLLAPYTGQGASGPGICPRQHGAQGWGASWMGCQSIAKYY